MKREQLLHFIEEALRLEEQAVASYAKHISSTIVFSGFTKPEQAKVAKTLKKLERDSRDHAARLLALKKRVEGEDRDVY